MSSIATVHPDIIQSHILNRLDAQSLASTSCTSPQFQSLCNDDVLWRQICNSTWPSTTHPTVQTAIASFPYSHRSFFSDSFASVRSQTLPGDLLDDRRKQGIKKGEINDANLTAELISAVDIYYDDVLLHSEVTTTETLSAWFRSSPFRIDLLSNQKQITTPLIFDGACSERAKERLRVSWILIDPRRKRAVNVASARAVEARRHWLTEDVQVRYSTVVGGVQCSVLLNCGGKEGGETHVTEVSMQVEDMEGKILNGRDSLGIIETVMEGQRRKNDAKIEEDIYEVFLRKKAEFRERKQRRERRVDMACVTAGISVFLVILTFLISN